MPGKKWVKPAAVPSETYRRWIRENPKRLKRSHIKLQTFPGELGTETELPAVEFGTKVKDIGSEKLQVFGYTKGKAGFKIFATVLQQAVPRYLVRGDHRHVEGPFTATNGKPYGPEQPHFHEQDWEKPTPEGWPSNAHVVTPDLDGKAGLPYHTFCQHFLDHYKFRDGRGKRVSVSPSHGVEAPPTDSIVSTPRLAKFGASAQPQGGDS